VHAPRAELDAQDFAPFKAMSDVAMGMSAHIVFSDIDPDAPATTSPKMMQVIRQDIGFDGLLMTDDISMEALSGTVAQRSTAAIKAGCDIILHCNGDPGEMPSVAAAAGKMTPMATTRANRALALRKTPENIDISSLEAELTALLG
jgi:beta-N-acetylhexosaminidase